MAIVPLGFRVAEISAQASVSDAARSSEPEPVAEPMPDLAPDPMAGFERLVEGSWRLGTMQTNRWRWGPGRRSIREHTVGLNSDDNPWRELLIHYLRPDREKVQLLSFHPDIPGIGRGVGEGTFEIHGDTASSALQLYQPGVRRTLATHWTLKGPDLYHEALLEDSGSGWRPLAEWDFSRDGDAVALPEPAAGDTPKPSKNIRAFVPLLGKWESGDDDGGATPVRAHAEWMEYLDVVAVRVEGGPDPGDATHLLDAYLYHHLGTDTLRCLALSASGAVYEGGVAVLEDGALELDLTRYGEDTVDRRLVRIGFEPNRELRTREWMIHGDDRVLVFDAHYRAVERQKD
jgi:hypothetical protein